jgi:hypothetical protein
MRPDRGIGVSPVQRVDNRRRGRLLVLLGFAIGGALFVRDVVYPEARRFWESEVAPRLAGQPPESARREPTPAEAADPGRVPPVVHPEELVEALQRARPVETRVPVRLSRAFRPGGFKVAAVSHALPLAAAPQPGWRLPATTGRAAYGTLLLKGGRAYPLLLVRSAGVYRLYLDRNGNGDLTDDGDPVSNEGTGGFAATLRLPLAEVAGQPLDGTYDLWVYLDERRDDRLQVYSRTQLSGEVALGGRSYPAVVADNVVLDGDYTNDGVAIDLDGDGRFKGPREVIGPGESLELSGVAYRFDVAW